MEGHMDTVLEKETSGKVAPWGETAAGLLPVIILSMAATLEGTSFQSLLLYTFLFLLVALPVIGFYVAWKRGFARWSSPYLALVVLDILLVFPIIAGQFVTSVWWIPFVQVGLILLLVFLFYHRVVDRRGKTTQTDSPAKHDWTQILFGVQTMTPMLVVVIFDEIAIALKTPFLLLTGFILALGGLVYLRSRFQWLGVAALLGSILLVSLMANAVTGIYWHGLYGWIAKFF
jgi:hypothetical protein